MSQESFRFNVFGRIVEIRRTAGLWSAFYPGAEGKIQPARDILVPPYVEQEDLERYLADLCHEWATPKACEVRRL